MRSCTRANSIAENLSVWNQEHAWLEDGDEWKGQAESCGVPYDEWKASVVERLITPYARPGSTILELAPGHGRWTGALASVAGRLILVDLSPACIEACQRRFAGRDRLETFVNDGRSLPPGLDCQVDLVWSFDSLVHVAPREIQSYLSEIHRVLRPGGFAVIHHANRRHWTLPLAPIRSLGPAWAFLYRYLSIGFEESTDGWRSAVSVKLFRTMANRAGLTVLAHLSRWGNDGRYGVPRHNDRVTILVKALDDLALTHNRPPEQSPPASEVSPPTSSRMSYGSQEKGAPG